MSSLSTRCGFLNELFGAQTGKNSVLTLTWHRLSQIVLSHLLVSDCSRVLWHLITQLLRLLYAAEYISGEQRNYFLCFCRPTRRPGSGVSPVCSKYLMNKRNAHHDLFPHKSLKCLCNWILKHTHTQKLKNGQRTYIVLSRKDINMLRQLFVHECTLQYY